MPLRITPHLVQLTYEAALKSFWRKEALRKFLRECHVTEAHISAWAADESKRDFLDRTFAALQRSDRGKTVIGQMAVFLAEQTSFPDLRNWEDSATKVSEASKAVAELNALLKMQNEEIRAEEERAATKEKARKEKEGVLRERMDLGKLMQRLNDLAPQMGTSPGGYAFQDWFYHLLNVSAEVILTHCAEVKVTHLGEDDGFFGAVDVDPGASSGDTSDGPTGRRGEIDRETAGLLAQHGSTLPA